MTLTEITVTHETSTGSIATAKVVDEPEKITLAGLRSSLEGVEPDHACWMRATAEEEWLRIPDNRVLHFVLSSYYTNHESISATFRPKGQPSPNTTPQLSRETSATRDEPETLFGLEKLSLSTTSVDNDVEPFTQALLRELDPSEILVIKSDIHTIAVSWSYLRSFITSKLSDGVGLFEIPLSAETRCGQMATIQLARPIWTRYILRGHSGADEMLELFASVCERCMSHENELRMLHADTELFLKLKIFVKDLLTFENSEDAQARLLEDPAAKFFFSRVYFNENEIERLLGFPTASGLPFSKILEMTVTRKVESVEAGQSRDYELCASHDLAPLVQQVFGIRKGFREEKGFKSGLKTFEKAWRRKSRTA